LVDEVCRLAIAPGDPKVPEIVTEKCAMFVVDAMAKSYVVKQFLRPQKVIEPFLNPWPGERFFDRDRA
jgi:hypothetical protein